MKVKEKLAESRGRPRKFIQGDTAQKKIRAPDNLLMELRVAARTRGVSTNDEIISRLIASLHYTPRRPLIQSEEGERLVALARMFDEFLLERFEEIKNKYPIQQTELENKRVFVPGPMRNFSCSFPENLSHEMEISARLNQCSTNQEISRRLLGSFNYFTEQQFPENEEVSRLRHLLMLFDDFINTHVADAERPVAPWMKDKK